MATKRTRKASRSTPTQTRRLKPRRATDIEVEEDDDPAEIGGPVEDKPGQ